MSVQAESRNLFETALMKIVERFVVPDLPETVRFQEFGAGIFSTIQTRSALKKAIKKGLLRIDGQMATTAKMINGGEVIELLEEKLPTKKPFIFDLKVLYEDDYLAVVLKPKGISTSGNRFATVANCLEQNLKFSQAEDATVPYPVHRLDYDTGGLLIAGKTIEARRKLHEMFAADLIQKTYHAVTVREMVQQKGIFEFLLDDKDAVTHFEVLKCVMSPRFGFLNLVELKPKTGRTHQLRRHLLEAGNPIMGDKKYFIQGYEHKGYGLYLQATRLEFRHPVTNAEIFVESELPKTFLRIFNR